MEDKKKNVRLLNAKEVKALIGFSNTTLYRLMAAGLFPLPLKTGVPPKNKKAKIDGRLVAWIESEVIRWQKENEPLTRMERAVYTCKGVKK